MEGELELTLVTGGTRLRLRVKAGARRTAVVGAHGGALKIEVNAPPERGKANDAVLQLVSSLLDLPASKVTLVSGTASRDKVIEVPLAVVELRRRLTAGSPE